VICAIRAALACLALLSLSPAFAKEQPPMPLGDALPVDIVSLETGLTVDFPEQREPPLGLAKLIIDKQADLADQRVAPLRALLADYDLGASVANAMRARLPSEGLATAPVVAVQPGARFAQAPAGGALTLYPKLSVTRDFEQIVVRMSAVYQYRKVDAKRGETRDARIFRDYSHALTLRHVTGNSATDDSARWASLGAAELTRLLDQAATELAEMLAYDFSPAGRLEIDKSIPWGASVAFAGKTFEARTLRRTDRSIWLRYGKASNQRIDGHYLVGDRPE
jgi:hypothetical protein